MPQPNQPGHIVSPTVGTGPSPSAQRAGKRRSFRFPEEVHEKLRWLAYKQRRSQRSIVVEAVRKALQEVKVPKEAKR